MSYEAQVKVVAALRNELAETRAMCSRLKHRLGEEARTLKRMHPREAINTQEKRLREIRQKPARSFFKECVDDICRVFHDHKRREGGAVLQCGLTLGGCCQVSDEQRKEHKIETGGIQGKKPRQGKQCFMVVFKNILASGKLLGLQGTDLVFFEDPRDCYEVHQKILALYKAYMRQQAAEQ